MKIMKKYFAGILAVVLALSATAFTTDHSKGNALLYWYHTMDNGTVIVSGAPLASTSADPFNCGGGPTKVCSKGFSSYDPDTNQPIGNPQQIVNKPN
jgi:hypothetical protein